MSKRKKILLGLTGIIILVLIFLPTLIKSYVIKNSKELVGRQIDIGKLKYNYFTSSIKIYDFKMFEQNENDIFTSFDTLIVNLEPYKLISNTKALEQLYIKGLMVRTIMKDSTFNFDDLIAYHNSPADTLETEEDENFKYELSNLELKDANFFFDNQDINHVTHIDNFSFFIPFIGWNQEEKSNADIKFNFKNGGYFESKLDIDPVSGEYDSEIIIKNLNLNPFKEYVAQYAEINDFKGSLNSQIQIHGNTNEAINSIISGHIDVNDFVMTDTNNKDVLTSKKIDCNLNKIDYANSSYVLDSLMFTQPYIYFEMDSITNNLYKLFKMDPEGNFTYEENESDSLDDGSDLYYAINNINITNGIMDYSDNLTGERFDYHLSEIKFDSKEFVSDADWVNMYSDMILNNRGTLNAKLGFNPKDYNYLNLDLSIENFLLSDINIYSQYYTGHSILVGDFYYYSSSIITNAEIVSENKLLVKNVEVQNNKNGLFSLPLKFALFLLKDKNGDVNLEVPVRGNLNDPEISIGKIVWTTLKRKITGAASNPINSLATLVDVNPKDYEELVFEYTDTIPNETQMGKLDKLLEIESKKEGLKIELVHFVDPQLQREAIAISELGKIYYQDTQKDYLVDKKGFETFLLTKTENDSLNIKNVANELVKPSTVDSLSNLYNNKLIKHISDYLKTAVDSTHITVLKSDLKEPDNVGSKSRFKIQFDLLDLQTDQRDSLKEKN